jgi:hypothetical protein
MLAVLGAWPVALAAQVGLASAGTTIALAARKPASLGVSLANASAARPGGGDPVLVTTWWDLEPERTGAVTLLAALAPLPDIPGWAPAGGAKRLAARPGRAGSVLRLFAEPVSAARAAGRRTDELPATHQPLGTLDLLVITQ